jgi:galactoside 2-L-fucosyltransferase 1/2
MLSIVVLLMMGVSRVLYWSQGRITTSDTLSTDKWVGFVAEGQLGNHMWELASTYGIARARNAKWCVIDLHDRYRTYAPHLHWIADPPLTKCPGIVWVNILFWFTPLLMPIDDDGVYAGYHRRYELSQWPRIRADGYLQSFKYFDSKLPVPFTLAAAPRARAWVKAKRVTAAIHVRRGDKLADAGNVVAPLAYFQLAVAELRRRFPRGRQAFVVVTDDPAWVRDHSFFGMMRVLSSSDPGFDMAVVSECRHKIISIGTFGWWGAFLNDRGDNSTSAVIYPRLQMQGGKRNGFKDEDYFPAHWIGIDYVGG